MLFVTVNLMIPMIIGSKIFSGENLSSTNSYAIRLLTSERPPEGTIITTDFQTAGRGQPGNSWESEAGKNLLFSIILYPDMINPSEQFIISMAVSLGIYDFVSRHTGRSKVKWPNDIYVDNDKIAGILIESSTIGEKVFYMVVGIGLNINQDNFRSNAPNPVSLRQITGKMYDTTSCLQEVAADLDLRYGQVLDGHRNTVKSDYMMNLYRYNEWTTFRDAEGSFAGMIKDVENDGRMIVETRSGKLKHYYFKEVEFIP